MRPKIGITTGFKDNQQRVSWQYVRAVEQAGGLPLILPTLTDADAAAECAALLDGLIITGGPGITQGLIGDLPDDLPPVSPERDTSDRLIFEAFRAAQQRPVLGICYGMQFINAQAGGTIYADLIAQVDGAASHSGSKRGGQPHPVRLVERSYLRDVLGQDEITVNTEHIQAVAQVGAGLQAVAFSPDGIIEAIESPDRRLLGVQFHPELLGASMDRLFVDFVARCRG